MLKNITPRGWETITEYTLVFDDGRGNGLCFYCDEDGNVLNENPQAHINLAWAKEHPERFVRFNKFLKHEREVRTLAHGTCECGEEVYLVNEYMGACECPNCGKWYNLFGQELNNPETWSEGDDW